MSLIKRTRKQPDGSLVTDTTWTLVYWDKIAKKKRSLNTERTVLDGPGGAREIEKTILQDIKLGRLPHKIFEYLQRRGTKRLDTILADYLAAGCPDRNLDPRQGDALSSAQRDLTNLRAWWGNKNPDTITVADCTDYHTARIAEIAARRTRSPLSTLNSQLSTHHHGSGPGHRTVDLELTTLSNAFKWAIEARRLDRNPLAAGRRRFCRGSTIRHCRELMPASAAELHLIASEFFKSEKSQVLGAQMILEALTGCRTSEILKLRWDAQRTGTTAQPGYLDTPHSQLSTSNSQLPRYLWINRSKKGINPFILLHPALEDFLGVWRTWCQAHHQNETPLGFSPWYLPGHGSNGVAHADKQLLTHALAHITKRLGLPHRTSHGLRAYYVTVRRAQGIGDAQIGIELGQSSGAQLITDVYGSVPPNWIGGPELTWIPTGQPPAWEILRPAKTNILQMIA